MTRNKKSRKKINVTIEDVFNAVNDGFTNMENRMATKQDLQILENKLTDKIELVETKLTNKIDKVQESVDGLGEVDIKNLEGRVTATEKDIRTLNKHVFKTA